MTRSLSFKLTLAFCLVSLIGVGLVAILASKVTVNQVNSLLNQQEQMQIADELGAYFEVGGNWQTVNSLIGGAYSPRSFVVVNEANEVVLQGLGLPLGKPIPEEVTADKIPIEVNGRIVGYLVSFQPARLNQPANNRRNSAVRIIENVNRSIIYGAIGAIIFSSLIGYYLTQKIIQPIHELTTASEAIAAGDLSQRIKVIPDNEIGKLAAAFNKMSSDLLKSQEQRQQMTADIAHDLRAPLNLIIGHAEALRDGVPATHEALHTIHHEAQRLNHLIEDLRTLTLADSGQLSLHKRNVSPADLINRAGYAHKPAANEKNIDLSIVIEEGLPQIYVDPHRIGQVLDNLLVNALRYTPKEGNIWLQVAKTEHAFHFSVQDSGSGISEEDLANIFNRFYRAGTLHTRDEGGSGLGLAIARSLVIQHNGRIWAESQPNQGATFNFTIPLTNT